ncbi:CoA transferase [Paraburkholderia sp. MM6662-R1]|uniref:CoA transferase n=1 Tax=Paraburkholderia sp. MM6662-R1 TaxID=2991066 RepID=UPI003D194487
MYELLKGLRVVECASFIAGPSCSLHLQQFGAQVIRIDPIGGGPDFGRWPVTDAGDSLYWEGLNKGKRSIAIDFSREEGRRLAVEIITASGPNAGLFVTNFPQGGLLAHDKLKVRRSDLITVRIAGWSDGAPAVDYTVNAAIGIPFMTGSDKNGSDPVNHVLPAWDLLAGAYAAFSLLAAERHRRETGEGGEVTVPLSDVAIASLGHMGQIAEVLMGGERPRIGNALYGAFGRDFTTSDGRRVMVVAITSRQWQGLVDALELGSDVSSIERSLGASFVSDEGLRFQHRNELFGIVERAIRSIALAELERRFASKGACWSVYRTLSEAIRDEPRFSTSGPLFETLTHPSGKRYPTPGSAATFQGKQRLPVQAAPRLGADTDWVLQNILQLDKTDVGALHDAGIVSGVVG